MEKYISENEKKSNKNEDVNEKMSYLSNILELFFKDFEKVKVMVLPAKLVTTEGPQLSEMFLLAHGKNRGHVNDNKSDSFHRARGRWGSKPNNNRNGRQRNIGHKNENEHSRVAKGSNGFFKGFFKK